MIFNKFACGLGQSGVMTGQPSFFCPDFSHSFRMQIHIGMHGIQGGVMLNQMTDNPLHRIILKNPADWTEDQWMMGPEPIQPFFRWHFE